MKEEDSKDSEKPTLNPLEEKRLDSVYRLLVQQNMAQKHREYKNELAKLDLKYKVEEDMIAEMKEKQKSELINQKNAEEAKLFERCQKITEGDLLKVLKALDMNPSVALVRDMIWEVDDDMDECVCLEELKSMYERCSRDQEGLELRQLFNLVQFLMFLNDFEHSKEITSEDTLQLLFIQHSENKAALDESLRALFGPGKGKDKNGEEMHLTYAQYLEKVNQMAREVCSPSKEKNKSVRCSTHIISRSHMSHK